MYCFPQDKFSQRLKFLYFHLKIARLCFGGRMGNLIENMSVLASQGIVIV